MTFRSQYGASWQLGQRHCCHIVSCHVMSYSLLHFYDILVPIWCIAKIELTVLRSPNGFSDWWFAVIALLWRFLFLTCVEGHTYSSSFLLLLHLLSNFFFLSLLLFFFYQFSSFFSFSLYISLLHLIPTCPLNPSRVALCEVRDDPPFLVVRYLDDFPDRLDGRRFGAMRLSQDGQTGRDEQHGPECDTALGACKKRWWHWDSCSASDLSCCFSKPDLPCFHCYEEVGYVQGLGNIVAHIGSISEDDWTFVRTMLSLFRILTIRFTPFRIARIAHVTWT